MRHIIQQLNMIFGQHKNTEHTQAVNRWYQLEYSRNGIVFSVRDVDEQATVMRLMDCINAVGLPCDVACKHILPIPYVNQWGAFDVGIEFLPGAFETIIREHVQAVRWAVVRTGDDFVFEGPTQPIYHKSSGAQGQVIGAYVECVLKAGDAIVCMLDSEELHAGMSDLLTKKLSGLSVCDDVYNELAIGLVFQRMRDDALGSYLEGSVPDVYAAYYAYATFGLERYDQQKIDNKVYGSWGGVIAHKKRVFSAEDVVVTKEKTKSVLKLIDGQKSAAKPASQPSTERPSLRLVSSEESLSEEVATEWGVF